MMEERERLAFEQAHLLCKMYGEAFGSPVDHLALLDRVVAALDAASDQVWKTIQTSDAESVCDDLNTAGADISDAATRLTAAMAAFRKKLKLLEQQYAERVIQEARATNAPPPEHPKPEQPAKGGAVVKMRSKAKREGMPQP